MSDIVFLIEKISKSYLIDTNFKYILDYIRDNQEEIHTYFYAQLKPILELITSQLSNPKILISNENKPDSQPIDSTETYKSPEKSAIHSLNSSKSKSLNQSNSKSVSSDAKKKLIKRIEAEDTTNDKFILNVKKENVGYLKVGPTESLEMVGEFIFKHANDQLLILKDNGNTKINSMESSKIICINKIDDQYLLCCRYRSTLFDKYLNKIKDLNTVYTTNMKKINDMYVFNYRKTLCSLDPQRMVESDIWYSEYYIKFFNYCKQTKQWIILDDKSQVIILTIDMKQSSIFTLKKQYDYFLIGKGLFYFISASYIDIFSTDFVHVNKFVPKFRTVDCKIVKDYFCYVDEGQTFHVYDAVMKECLTKMHLDQKINCMLKDSHNAKLFLGGDKGVFSIDIE